MIIWETLFANVPMMTVVIRALNGMNGLTLVAEHGRSSQSKFGMKILFSMMLCLGCTPFTLAHQLAGGIRGSAATAAMFSLTISLIDDLNKFLRV